VRERITRAGSPTQTGTPTRGRSRMGRFFSTRRGRLLIPACARPCPASRAPAASCVMRRRGDRPPTTPSSWVALWRLALVVRGAGGRLGSLAPHSLARASLSSDLGCRRCPVHVGDGADVDDEARSRGPACLDPTICVGCAYPTHARGLPRHRRKVRFGWDWQHGRSPLAAACRWRPRRRRLQGRMEAAQNVDRHARG
jgi:hypothetical protein